VPHAATQKQDSKPKPEPKAEVEVLYNGRTEEFKYHPGETVKELLDKALQRFGVVQNPHLMSLFDDDGTELADDLTLAQAKVKRGEELVLRQSAVKGG
jgi:hypothetical protein